AGLTIICMLTFVLSSGVGRGDFFSELERLFGGRSSAAEPARLFGKRVDPEEIRHVREQRRLANLFMEASMDMALGNTITEILKPGSDFDSQLKSQLQNVIFYRRLIQQAGFGQESYQQQIFGLLNQLEAVIERLRAEKKTSDADKVIRLRDLLHKDLIRMRQ